MPPPPALAAIIARRTPLLQTVRRQWSESLCWGLGTHSAAEQITAFTVVINHVYDVQTNTFQDENDCEHLSDLTIQLILVCVINEQTRTIGHGGLSVSHCREHALFNNTPLLVN